MIFHSKDLDRTKLPLRRNVMEYFLFLRRNAIHRGASAHTSYLQFSSEVAREIRGLWRVKSIPLTSNDMILKSLKEILKGYNKVIKNPNTVDMLFWDELLIISHCKCGIERGNNCTCEYENKIPSHAKSFYIDQCGPRKRLLVDDERDNNAESDSDDTMDIDEEEEDPGEYSDDTNFFEDLDFGDDSDADEQEIIDSDDETEREPRPGPSDEMFAVEESNRSQSQPPSLSGPPSTIRQLHLKNYYLAADRAGLKDRQAAYLAKCLLKDAKVNVVVDRHKFRRDRQIMRLNAIQSVANNKLLKGISFGGKRLNTSHVKEGQIVNEENVEHFVMVKEPGSRYIGHITPRNEEGKSVGTAIHTFRAIVEYLRENGYSLDDIVAISCDGTNINTGSRNDVIMRLENEVDRPLQWLVCLFHFNDLPFKKLYENLCGESKGPDIYCGDLGKEIQSFSVEKYPVVLDFEVIGAGQMPDAKDMRNLKLSGDQRYFFDMVMAVNNGEVPNEVAQRKAPKIHKTQWLNTASILLRIYVSKSKPSHELRTFVEYSVKVYAPFWFLVKTKPLAIHGSRHIFKFIQWSRELSQIVKNIARASLHQNGFFCHPENILLAMITDEDPAIREDGFNKILGAREKPVGKIRTFCVPNIRYECGKYTDMIHWENINITPPPCLYFHSDEYLSEFKNSDDIISIPEYPCHTQNTERFIELLSEHSKSVTSDDLHGHITSVLEAQTLNLYPNVESKKDVVRND